MLQEGTYDQLLPTPHTGIMLGRGGEAEGDREEEALFNFKNENVYPSGIC